MTNLLDPKFAASKASRKERQQANEPPVTAATERAMATILRSLNKQAKKEDAQERLRVKAINDTMPELIAAMDEEFLAPFFFGLERLATAANRRRITTHPLRPEIVDVLHKEADAEEARAAEAEERSKAQPTDSGAKPEKATPNGAAPVGASTT